MSQNHIDTHAEVNTDTFLDQLDAMREALNDIEKKIAPEPAQFPDTFEQTKIFVAPYVKHSTDFYRECTAFKSKVDDYMMSWRRIRRSMPCNGNFQAWAQTFDSLTTAFDEMAESTMSQVFALGSFYRHLGYMAAMACNCDVEQMEKVLQNDETVEAGRVEE